MRRLLTFCVAAGLGSAAAPGLAAQQPDSVMIRLLELQRQVDSLQRALAAMQTQGRDTTPTADALADLRAAARAAAARTPARDTTSQGSRTRNLQDLNPEISVTGDFVGNLAVPSGEDHSLSGVPREFEFSFQAVLDPFTRTKIFVTREEDFEIAGFPEEEGEEHAGGFEIEEGYMYWVGLPGGFGAKVGKFRQEIGLYNRWHTHALLNVERPLAATTFLGEDGLIQTGVGVTLPSFTVGPATQTITVEATRGNNEALFEEGSKISYLARFQNFWELSPSAYVQLGTTGVYGENDEAALQSKVLGLDLSFRWTPAVGGTARGLQFKSEWYFVERTEAGADATGNGGYAQLDYRADRRWVLGVRTDYVSGFDDAPNLVQLAPTVTWWQSEWVRLRLQYNMLRPEGGAANHTLLFQTVWAMGPHKHETY